MATIVKAPNPYDSYGSQIKVFLAGSIEMGKAEDWQTAIQEHLNELDILILNPRRDVWDADLTQRISNPEFLRQVQWEHDALEDADVIIMYFDGATKSPITLLELGIFADSDKLIVCCPDNFWRRGNVEFICKHYDIPLVSTYSDLCELATTSITYCSKMANALKKNPTAFQVD